MRLIGYDTETWSSNQISAGLEHYFSDPEFEIICAAWAGSNHIHTADSTGFRDEALTPHGVEVVCAHNMHFDRSAADTQIGGEVRVLWFDTMIAVRAILGASAGRNTYISLDKSAKLLLPEEFHKDAAGAGLMPMFSFPSQANGYGRIPWRKMREDFPDEWEEYLRYCGQDARVAYKLADLALQMMGPEDFGRLVLEAELTYRMNQVGWPVDTKLLQVMIDRAQENTDTSLDSLIAEYNPGWSTVKKNGDEQFKPLNLNSGVQLKKWLGERDIVIENAQADTITETIEFVQDNLDLRPDWAEALAVLQSKVDLGGATLKKLQPLSKGLSSDGRFRQAYNHIGASATHRTTSSGVQFQNMKRLPDDVEDLTESSIAAMNNGELAVNIRQLFKAQNGGEIVVADLKSIEGLLVGWVFGVDWMVEAVRDGKDMYSMSASQRFRVPYETVSPSQRRTAKTGVLGGNYGGGYKAYMKQSPSMTEDEAKADVRSYRDTIPNLVQGWWDLNDLLLDSVREGDAWLPLHNGYTVSAYMTEEPMEGLDDPSLEIVLAYHSRPIFSRFWHGVRIEQDDDGRDEVTYAVAEEKKTATEMWKRETAKGDRYKLYGGKLTGTLIQSLARELYFYQLELLTMSTGPSTFQVIGQLHDEIVVEWMPNSQVSLESAMDVIEHEMSEVPWYLHNCPVRVKVSHAPRYIK